MAREVVRLGVEELRMIERALAVYVCEYEGPNPTLEIRRAERLASRVRSAIEDGEDVEDPRERFVHRDDLDRYRDWAKLARAERRRGR